LKKIDTSAFHFAGLESATIEGATQVMACAFQNCARLSAVSLSKDVLLDPGNGDFDDTGRIGNAPFRNCESLKSVSWGKRVKKDDFYFFDPYVKINKKGIPFF
jgi:hypothetical protein